MAADVMAHDAMPRGARNLSTPTTILSNLWPAALSVMSAVLLFGSGYK